MTGRAMVGRAVVTVAAWCVTAIVVAGAPDAITVTGCVTRSAASGWLVRTPPSDAASPTRTTAGSNTSRASTPIGGARLVADHPSSGSNTPKGSTPVSRGSRKADSKESNSSNTSKASTPIPHRVAAATTYELDLDAERLSSYVGQTVTIAGTTSQSAGASKLTVESIRVITPGCSY
jgi:hypothetical protein